MSVEESKSIAKRIVYEFVNTGNTAAADELFGPELIDHRTGQPDGDRDSTKRFLISLRTAFPDLKFAVEHVFGEGDMVVVHVIAEATQRGEFVGIPPTGKKVVIKGTTILRIANGRAVERWNIVDVYGVIQQLGATVKIT
jgi:steroid delta-isomerase-like uncharacterized protein